MYNKIKIYWSLTIQTHKIKNQHINKNSYWSL